MVRRFLLGCGIVSSVWYVITDLIGTLRYPGYSYADQWFSELTAQGAPTRPLMIALNEIPYNLLVLACAAGVRESAGRKRAGRITADGLAGFSVFGFVTGVFFPMPTREAAAAGEGTLRNTMHIPGTIVMSLSLVLAMVFGSTLLRKRFRYYSYGTILAVFVGAFLAGRQAPQIAANQPTPWGGIYERMNIYPTMLWVAVLAIGLLRAQKAR
jgi:drug/metabolite transporter (DMT)-like permease